MPDATAKEPISYTYPSADRFEEILQDAEALAQSPSSRSFIKDIRERYMMQGMDLELTSNERLNIRRLSQGVIS